MMQQESKLLFWLRFSSIFYWKKICGAEFLDEEHLTSRVSFIISVSSEERKSSPRNTRAFVSFMHRQPFKTPSAIVLLKTFM